MPAPREGAAGGDETGGRPGTSSDTPTSSGELDWGAQYLNCPEFCDIYTSVQWLETDWPEGYQYKRDRLLYNGKVCIPTPYRIS